MQIRLLPDKKTPSASSSTACRFPIGVAVVVEQKATLSAGLQGTEALRGGLQLFG
jgi:hypothetical protein